MFHICQKDRSRSPTTRDKTRFRPVVLAGGDLPFFLEKVDVRADFPESLRMTFLEEPRAARVRSVFRFALAMDQVLPVSSGAQDGF